MVSGSVGWSVAWQPEKCRSLDRTEVWVITLLLVPLPELAVRTNLSLDSVTQNASLSILILSR